MYKAAVLFDLDGTLVTTSPEYREKTVSETLGHFGIIPRNGLVDQLWFSARRSDIVRSLGIDPANFWRTFSIYDSVEQRVAATRPFPDVAVLSHLQKSGVKMAIVTGAPPEVARQEAALISGNYFAHIISANSLHGLPAKPHPQGIYNCLELLGIGPASAVYVGNGDEDIEAGKNAGVLDIHVDRKEWPLSVDPSRRINGLNELLELFEL